MIKIVLTLYPNKPIAFSYHANVDGTTYSTNIIIDCNLSTKRRNIYVSVK